MEYLFSKDGKKYAVVNKIIGTTQIICKEVFIEKGTDNEVLSNNIFTLDESCLFNVPVESYQEKRENELKKRLQEYESEFNMKASSIQKKLRGYDAQNKDFLEIRNRILQFCKDKNDPFIMLLDFITGSFKFVVLTGYDTMLFSKEDFFKYMKNSKGMKGVVPNYASNNPQDRILKIYDYSDGSGGSRGEIHLFKNEKDAKEFYTEMASFKLRNRNVWYSDDFKKAEELGMEIPKDKIHNRLASLNDTISNEKGAFNKRLESLTNEVSFLIELKNKDEE